MPCPLRRHVVFEVWLFFFRFVSLSFLTVVPSSWVFSFVDPCAMLLDITFLLRFVVAVLTVVPGHVFIVDSCAMLLECAFLLRFVVAVLTVVPGHVFVVDICAMLLEIAF